MGIEPVDYATADLEQRVRALVPAGVDAAFDHLGLESTRISYSLLARGGAMIAYGNAASLRGSGSVIKTFLAFIAQILLWRFLPNSHYANFYNFWAGSSINPKAFRSRLREDLTALFQLLADGAINPPIAACFPLSEVSAAMILAESRTVRGKVILLP